MIVSRDFEIPAFRTRQFKSGKIQVFAFLFLNNLNLVWILQLSICLIQKAKKAEILKFAPFEWGNLRVAKFKCCFLFLNNLNLFWILPLSICLIQKAKRRGLIPTLLSFEWGNSRVEKFKWCLSVFSF